MKILSIVGARPQFIKLAPLSKRIRENHNEIIIHSGQHFDDEMSNIFFTELSIEKPNYNLGINQGLHGEQTGRMLIEFEKVVLKEEPDLIIVFGDTNTTLAATLVGSKISIPVLHIEAGLRSFNRSMPEEINRIVADHTSEFLFAPTLTAMNNLKNENLSAKAYLTGDIMVDSLKFAVSHNTDCFREYNVENNDYYLVTLHRPYNVDEPDRLSRILNGLGKVSKKVIFPVHPRTHQVIKNNNIKIPINISLIKPVGYLSFANLQLNSQKIITDSGGIQKEAYILKKPCITLRPETEWIETVEAGWNLLLNPNTEDNFAEQIDAFEPTGNYKNIFGENVAEKMLEIINTLMKFH